MTHLYMCDNIHNEKTVEVAVCNMTSEQIVKAYVTLRDKKAELKAEHAKQLAPYDEALEKLEAQMMQVLDASGAESIRTPAGTAYKSSRTSVTVADKSAFMDYIQQNMAFELLDVKANKTAVEGFLSEHEDLPPGVNMRREAVVGFRRA